ncbi:MAG: hypothetical protein J6A87_00390, partial [Clostridia bacterium]|nr:hypothetical protein [Clostridia bacterium]
EYVFITDENCLDYVGHHFVAYSETGYELIVLEEAYLTRERTGSYSLLTACNDNAYAEGVLTITPKDSLGLPLFFAVEEDMTYDDEAMQADIEKYGLYTYEEWSEYLTYEQFVAFNGKYYKIFVGKGLLTEEDLQRIILGLKL